MANAFLKAEKIISQGLGLLQRELILPRLVSGTVVTTSSARRTTPSTSAFPRC
jgi:hypothetical protein